jgi:hypothetical protein
MTRTISGEGVAVDGRWTRRVLPVVRNPLLFAHYLAREEVGNVLAHIAGEDWRGVSDVNSMLCHVRASEVGIFLFHHPVEASW